MASATKVRAAVHVHSTWSYDASWPLADLAREFAERDYQVVLMAEHDQGFDEDRWHAYRRACSQASSDRLLLVPGIEYSDGDNRVHLPTWGELPFFGEGRATGQVLRSVGDHGGTAILAHPARKGVWEVVEPEWTSRLMGIEAWNPRYDGDAPSPAALALLAKHRDLVPFVDLDFHQAGDFRPLAMELELSAFTPDAVYAALAARRCRPTTPLTGSEAVSIPG